MFQNLKIRQVLMYGTVLVIFTLLVSASVAYTKIISMNEKSTQQTNLVLPGMLDYLELKLDVVQVQQWLTDVSATRAAEGYDDGYDEAKRYYDFANKRLDSLIARHKKIGDNERVEKLQAFKKNFHEYYGVGINMANSYVKFGPVEGNKWMSKLDPFAEKLTEELEVWVVESTKDTIQTSKSIDDDLAEFLLQSFIFVAPF